MENSRRFLFKWVLSVKRIALYLRKAVPAVLTDISALRTVDYNYYKIAASYKS